MVNLNRASEKELTEIVNIGKVRAKLIVENRPFKDIYELSSLLGLGTKRMAAIINQNIITV